eukprot:SAG31_NODE_1593_length_7811_cov_13.037215_7_plen_80_part_00
MHAQPYAMRKLMDFVGLLRWRTANPCCPRAYCLFTAPSAVHEWLITVVNLSYEVHDSALYQRLLNFKFSTIIFEVIRHM